MCTVCPPFCHNSRVWQTDGQTDRQTEFSSLDRICIPCSSVIIISWVCYSQVKPLNYTTDCHAGQQREVCNKGITVLRHSHMDHSVCTSQSQGFWPVPSYTAWWQPGVSNLIASSTLYRYATTPCNTWWENRNINVAISYCNCDCYCYNNRCKSYNIYDLKISKQL